MKCPYCNTKLDENALFCEQCGQSVVGLSKNTDATNKYWADVDALNTTNEKEYQNVVRKAKTEAMVHVLSTIKIIIIVAVAIVVLIVPIIALNANSQQKLDLVKSEAVGNTYSNTRGVLGLYNGAERDRIIVKIKDESTLSYTSGNYTMRIFENSYEWIENEIYESCDYEYSFSTSLFGKITLEFNGKSCEVYTDDEDGTINSIDFYGD